MEGDISRIWPSFHQTQLKSTKSRTLKKRHGTPPRRIGRWCLMFLLNGNNSRYIYIIYIYKLDVYQKNNIYIYTYCISITISVHQQILSCQNLPLKEKKQILPFLSVWKNLRPHHEAAASEVVTPPSRQWNSLPPVEGVTVRGKSVEKTREGSLGNLNLKTSGKLYV